jgi:hypothetical protein
MLRSGGVDKSTVQSEEVWTGKLLSLDPFMQLFNSVGNPDPHIFGPPSEVRIRILPFSHKVVERTEIILAN